MAPPLTVFPLVNVIYSRLTVIPGAMVNMSPFPWASIMVSACVSPVIVRSVLICMLDSW